MSKKSEIPLEGFGKFIIGFLPAVRKILAPCAQHSQLAIAKINCLSKLHVVVMFWVNIPFLPMYGTWSLEDIVAGMCTLFIALIQS